MKTLTILVAVAALAACKSTTASPAPAADSTKVAQSTRYDFSDLPDKELRVSEFLKECQTRTGFNFTYGAEAAVVVDKSFVRFSRSEPMTPEEFDGALQQVLRTRGLEAKRIGPEHLRVYEVHLLHK